MNIIRKKTGILLVMVCFNLTYVKLYGRDTVFIKVHFLYGSKPAKKYKATEKKWFGGILGGHVGIESDSDKVFNFIPKGDLHYVSNPKDKHSTFAVHSLNNFWSILGGDADEVKKATVIIPISEKQKNILDSIYKIYMWSTPYDYAFIGMRCGSAAYDILGQMGIVKYYTYRKTWKKIFYPKKLRRIILEKAKINHWKVIRADGVKTRIWERD